MNKNSQREKNILLIYIFIIIIILINLISLFSMQKNHSARICQSTKSYPFPECRMITKVCE